MKAVGITGPAGSGKTTLFRALSGGRAGGAIAAVALRDPRLDQLSTVHSSGKTTPVHINILDVHAEERTEAAAIGRLRGVDAVVLVMPGFGGQDAERAFSSEIDNLILADLAPAESRLQRAKKDASLAAEVETLKSAIAQLESGRLLSERDWEAPDLHALTSIAPITLKPVIAIYNVDESKTAEQPPQVRVDSLAACLLLEAEAAELDIEESREILSGYGIDEPVADRVVAAVLRNLELITFFVTDRTESRGLELHRGSTALEAAGHVHSDMQRGFIRAEVSSFQEVVEAGSWEAAKAASLVRVEGREYVVADGDVIRFRFSV